MGRWRAHFEVWGLTLVALLPMASYYLKTTGPVAAGILIGLQLLAWGFYIVRASRAIGERDDWWTVWMLPVSMALVDLAIVNFSPHGAWGSLAVTQVDFLPVVQIASVTGRSGIVFLVGLGASMLAFAVVRRERPMLAPLLVLVGALGFGAWRLSVPETGQTSRFAMVTVDALRGTWPQYEAETRAVVQQGAQVVVWGEKLDRLTAAQSVERREWSQRLAAELRVVLIVGVQVENRNVAWVVDGVRGTVDEYDKQQMVPFLEADLKPGVRDWVGPLGGVRAGVAICRDVFFPKLGRRYEDKGARVMFSPAWDFVVDAWLSSRVAVLTGVEGKFGVIRAAREGYLLATDDRGRVVASVPEGKNVRSVVFDWHKD